MAGMVGDSWSFADFAPMDAIPTAVSLTTYSGGVADFMATPLQQLIDRVAAGSLPVAIGRVFHLDDIVEAHRVMEANKAGGKVVVLTR
jgi:NADPH:quinone reductase-like Zn-dependent oxidoreductase